MTDFVTSADGSTLAVETFGTGSPVILIGGAFNDRSTVAALASALAPHVTAVTYDRRGRGESTDNDQNFAVEREVEDLAAIIKHVGGASALFGHSSGGALALEAVLAGLPVTRLAIYELAVVADGNRPEPPPETLDHLISLVRAGDRAGAAEAFLTGQVGVPAEMVAGMRSDPSWDFLVSQAHSLPYDVAVSGPGLRLRPERLAGVHIPTLVVTGDQSWPWMQAGTRSLAAAIPGARFHVLPGQDHGVLNHPEALRPLLADWVLSAG